MSRPTITFALLLWATVTVGCGPSEDLRPEDAMGVARPALSYEQRVVDAPLYHATPHPLHWFSGPFQYLEGIEPDACIVYPYCPRDNIVVTMGPWFGPDAAQYGIRVWYSSNPLDGRTAELNLETGVLTVEDTEPPARDIAPPALGGELALYLDVLEFMQTQIGRLVAQGHCIDGVCTPVPELTNTTDYLAFVIEGLRQPDVPPGGGWVECAAEGGRCAFAGTEVQVAYGAASRWRFQAYFDQFGAGSVACGNDTFGDPIVGVGKGCFYRPVHHGRTGRIEAENHNGQSGGMGTEPAEGGTALNFITDQAWAAYSDIDLTGANTFEYRVASAMSGSIEVHVGYPSSEPIAVCAVANTGAWTRYVTLSCAIEPVAGTVNVFLKFVTSQPYAGNLNWFRFSYGAPAADLSGVKYIKADRSGKCVALAGAGNGNGANVHQWDCFADGRLQWQFLPGQDGAYLIQNVHSSQCIDTRWDFHDGGRINQWDCSYTNPAQQWQLVPVGVERYKLVSTQTGLAMTVAENSTANGADVQQTLCHDVASQLWTLVSAR